MVVKKEKRKYADRRKYLIGAVKRRRKKIRFMAIEYKGGKCSVCGYARCIEALELHHLDLMSLKKTLVFQIKDIHEVGKR